MSICTFGLYEIYWFYKNWNLIKQREGTNIAPFWRAVFGYFFCYQCFSRIRAHAESLDLSQSVPAGPLATGWIITSLLWNSRSILAGLDVDISFHASGAGACNRINSTITPHHDPNRRFSVWNLVGIVVGAIFMILAIIS